MQQHKLYSNLTFQKHGLIQLSLSLFPAPPIILFSSLPFSICSLLSPSLIPVTFPQLLFLSITLQLYFSLLLSLVMYLFLMVTLLHSVSLYIRCGWVESKVNRSCLNPSRSQSFSPLPEQTLKPIKGLILFFCGRGLQQVNTLYFSDRPLRAAALSSLLLLLAVLTDGFAHDWYSSVAKQTKRDKSRLLSVCEIRL